jgi:hypothetical protein
MTITWVVKVSKTILARRQIRGHDGRPRGLPIASGNGEPCIALELGEAALDLFDEYWARSVFDKTIAESIE